MQITSDTFWRELEWNVYHNGISNLNGTSTWNYTPKECPFRVVTRWNFILKNNLFFKDRQIQFTLLGVPTDKPHFETQEGDTEYITESGKERNGHDILNFNQRKPLHTCSVGEKSSVNPSHCHRDASMVLIHVLPLKFAGLVRQVQKRDYGRDIKKESWWKEGHNLLVPPLWSNWKKNRNLCPFVGDLHPYTCWDAQGHVLRYNPWSQILPYTLQLVNFKKDSIST